MTVKNAPTQPSYVNIFSAEVSDISFTEMMGRSTPVIINLSVLKAIRLSDDALKRFAVLITPFLKLASRDQEKVVFFGDPVDIQVLLTHLPCAKYTLLNNPSISKILSEVDA